MTASKAATFRLVCRGCGATNVVPAPIGGKRTKDGWKSSSRTRGWACPDCQRFVCPCGVRAEKAATDAEISDGLTAEGFKKRIVKGKPIWQCATCAAVPSKRGFAAMSPEARKAIASKGGKTAQALGVAHNWTAEQARQAGRKGGIASRGGRGKLSSAA